jgi:methyl-accepting chemotaxis protein
LVIIIAFAHSCALLQNFDFFRQVHLSLTDRISKGDLTTSADIDRRDEIGQLAEALSRLQKSLQGGSKMKAAA